VRQVGDALGDSLERPVVNFIQQESEQNGSGEAENETVEAEKKGVFQKPRKERALHELDEPLETHPVTSEKAVHYAVPGKGYGNRSDAGNVFEDYKTNNDRKKQQIESGMFSYLLN
jgi:hypothetical protein